jgi:multidrug resistance efflux pump
MLPSRAGKRTTKLNYDDLGRAVVDRLLELARDDGLRAAQVEAFAAESAGHRKRVEQLEEQLEESKLRETDLRVKLKAAEEALERAEENLRKAFGSSPRPAADGGATSIEDEDARAVLDILRSGRG